MLKLNQHTKLFFIAVFASLLIVLVVQFLRPGPVADTDRLLSESRRAQKEGDVAKAGALLDEILTWFPDDPEALLERSKLWKLIGDQENALADLKSLQDTKSKKVTDKIRSQGLYLEGSMHIEANRSRKAEKAFLEAWKWSQEDLRPLEHVLRLYTLQMRRGDIRSTLDQIESRRTLLLEEMVLRTDAGGPIIDERDAFGQLEAFVQADPEDEPSLQALLRYYIASERFEDAIRLVDGSPSKVANRSAMLGLKTISLLQTNNDTEARKTIGLPISDSPPNYWWWLAVGRVAELTQPAMASKAYQQAVLLQPESGFAHYRLGIALEASGDQVKAQTHLGIAANIDRLHQVTGVITRMVGMSNQELVTAMLRISTLSQEVKLDEETPRWARMALTLDPNNEYAKKLLLHEPREKPIEIAELRSRGREAYAEVARWMNAQTASNNRSIPSTTVSPANPIQMEDIHQSIGLDFQYFNGNTGQKYLIEAMGGGIGVIDFDLDGWPDCYFPQGSSLPNNPDDFRYLDQLYRNVHGEKFVNVTKDCGIIENGYSQGVAAGDINNDGFPDLVVANFGRNRVFINQGDGTFLEETNRWGLNRFDMSTSVALTDFDNDGNLDLYVTNYVDGIRICRDAHGNISTCNPQNFSGVQDRIYRNSGDGVWIDETDVSGILAPDGKGLGVVTSDFDDDGLMDIYVANDTTPNALFKNLGGFRFQEMGLESGTALSPEGNAQAGMGIAAADLNGDLLIDLFVTNFYFEPNNLYLNRNAMCFTDEATSNGISRASKLMLGFGVQAEDMDLDGDLDLIVANGHIDDFTSRGEPWKMPTQLFRNLGGGVFEEQKGMDHPYFSQNVLGRAIASLDWNGDGKKDFIVVHQDRPVALLENRTQCHNSSLSIQLIGTSSNRSAIGTRIIMESTGGRVRRDVQGGDGFYSTNERMPIFSKPSSGDTSITIHWPSGLKQEVAPGDQNRFVAIEP